MNTIYFECKVKFRAEKKVVTESYLVDAISYTEAESRINKEMQERISDEFKVTNIRATNFAEVHGSENGDYWFKSKISLVAYDEESGRERKASIYILVQANDVKEAYTNTVEIMKKMTGDYSIPSVSETKIIDCFVYNS